MNWNDNHEKIILLEKEPCIPYQTLAPNIPLNLFLPLQVSYTHPL